jgi:DNA-binding GntR family transcriptional regulator
MKHAAKSAVKAAAKSTAKSAAKSLARATGKPPAKPKKGAAPGRRGRRAITIQLDIQPMQRETTVDRIYQQLRDLLIRGQLQPGEIYTIRGLATALNTSTMPVRSVLHMLVAEGALEILPNRSVRVPLVSPERYSELCEIRAALEGLAASMAVKNAAPGLAAQLSAINDEYALAMKHSDRQKIFTANRQFHFCLYAHSEAPALLRLIETVWLLTGPYVNITFAHQKASDEAVLNHRRIIATVTGGEPAKCRRAIEGDIRSACEFTLKELQKFPALAGKREPAARRQK